MDIIQANLSKECKRIRAKFDPRDLRLDSIGYFLIRINKDHDEIELGFCRRKNIIDLVITGKNAEEIYHTFANQGLELRQDHMAYLGRELTKAEICKNLKIEYIQDDELNLQK